MASLGTPPCCSFGLLAGPTGATTSTHPRDASSAASAIVLVLA